MPGQVFGLSFKFLERRTGDHYYEEDCGGRCKYTAGGDWECGAVECEAGLHPRGQLALQPDPACQERPHPGGNQCCVLWLCSVWAEEGEARTGDCENMVCGPNAGCDLETQTCQAQLVHITLMAWRLT